MEYSIHKTDFTLDLDSVHIILPGDSGVSDMSFHIEDLRIIYRALVTYMWSVESSFKESLSLADCIERMLHDCGYHVFEDEKEE